MIIQIDLDDFQSQYQITFNKLFDEFDKNWIEVQSRFKQLEKFLFTTHMCVAGGVFRSLIDGTPPRDVDLFFERESHFQETLKRFKESDKYGFIDSSEKSVTFNLLGTPINVDLICYQYGTLDQILSRFDFTIAAIGMKKLPGGTTILSFHMDAFSNLLRKELIVSPDYMNQFDFTSKKAYIPEYSPGDIERSNKANQLYNRMIRYINYGYTPDQSVKKTLFHLLNPYAKPTEVSSKSY